MSSTFGKVLGAVRHTTGRSICPRLRVPKPPITM